LDEPRSRRLYLKALDPEDVCVEVWQVASGENAVERSLERELYPDAR
jgi:hypothetical protein